MSTKITDAVYEINKMDELAAMDSPVHRFSALSKLATTMLYIIFVVSFDKYSLSALIPMIFFPLALFSLSGISVKLCFYRMRFILPLVMAVGLFNPLFDHVPMFTMAGVTVTGGWVSMITLMIKGVYTIMASFLLIATTKIDDLCAALRTLHVPGILVTLFLLTYRYVFIMLEEAAVMTEAYHLRAPGQKGIAFSAWGSFLGQLLLRTIDQGERIFHSMRLRGFNNEFFYAKKTEWKMQDGVFLITCLLFFLFCRFVNISEFVGNLIVR